MNDPIDLLVRLVSGTADPALLHVPATWETVRAHAPSSGVNPMIAFKAREHVSGAARAWCDRVLMRCWSKHTRNLQDLSRTIAALEAAKIASISLKGPLLAQRCYQPPFVRKPAQDLDLAVMSADLPRAQSALEAIGYRPQLSIAEAKARTHHLEMYHDTLPRVELHFRLSHGAIGIPVEEFFERALPWTLPDGTKALVLAPSDLLLHLAL
ncbi:MAG TPA: nucleotidyltransferase family protein, partial [Bryobacteraceae bacterium]|nr:nucleotidyltransferase family protein [Bryobacteraceae bacterium]